MPLKKSSGVAAQESQFDANAKDLAAVTEKPTVTDADQGNVSQATNTEQVTTKEEASATQTADTSVVSEQAKQANEQSNEQSTQAQATDAGKTAHLDAERHEEPTSRAVATQTASTAVAVSTGAPNMHGRMDELEKEGFEGLELGFGAFPAIVLNSEGQMQTGDGKVIGDSFIGTVEASKEKFLVKNTKCEKRDEDFFYVFDKNWASNPKALDSQGRNAHEKVEEWAGKGWGYEVKKYLDVCVILTASYATAGGEPILEEGDMVLAQIPKTSIARFSGYAARQGLAGLRSVPSKFSVGQKITGVDYPYYPWDFRKA